MLLKSLANHAPFFAPFATAPECREEGRGLRRISPSVRPTPSSALVDILWPRPPDSQVPHSLAGCVCLSLADQPPKNRIAKCHCIASFWGVRVPLVLK